MSGLTVAEVLDRAENMTPRFMALMEGQKNECPVCGKRVMYQSYQTLSGSGIGQHIRSAHPEYADTICSIAGIKKKAAARKAKQEAAEALARPKRVHVVTGSFLDTVSGELSNLIGMMEAYWSQGNCADEAYALIERIEAMQNQAAAAAREVQS